MRFCTASGLGFDPTRLVPMTSAATALTCGAASEVPSKPMIWKSRTLRHSVCW
jgi:hypothetical protein